MKIQISTPRGSIHHTTTPNGKLKTTLSWNTGFGPRYTKGFGIVQKFIDSEVLRLSKPMVPLQSSMLIKSGTLGTDVGSGKVEYNAPYARYQYYGKLMVGRAPKRLTTTDLTYHGANRGAKWFERMKSLHKQSILEGAGMMMRRTTK